MHFTFRVFPGGVDFQTSELGPINEGPGDTSNAFFRAHEHAAASAARLRIPHYVLREDRGQERFGFGKWSAPMLLELQKKGYASFFDFASMSWVPFTAGQIEVTLVVEKAKKARQPA